MSRESKTLKKIVSEIKPLIYHCTELNYVYSDTRELDILSEGLLGPESLEKYDENPHGRGYGGSYAQEDTDKTNHISVWIYSENIGDLESTLNMIRSREITFVLNPKTKYELVDDHTDVEHYHVDEGLVESPVEINSENIELVIVGRKFIETNYNNQDTIPSLEEIEEEIEEIKSELDDRNIPVFETEKREYE